MEKTSSNTRTKLIWNKVNPQRKPSPKTVDSYSGSIWPQEDNAEAPSERYPSSGINCPSPAHHALALHANGHLSCSISSCLFLGAYNAEHNYKSTLETLPRLLIEININSQLQPPTELSGKLSGGSLLLKLLLQLQIGCLKQTVHKHCHELTLWQVLRQNRTLKHNNPMAKSTSADLCAHEN